MSRRSGATTVKIGVVRRAPQIDTPITTEIPAKESEGKLEILSTLFPELTEVQRIQLGQINFEGPEANEAYLNFLYLIKKIGFEQAIKSFQSKARDFIFHNPLMKEHEEHLYIEFENSRIKDEVVSSIYKCRRCNSDRTISTSKQIRRADEGSTVFITCSECGYKWTES